MIVTVTGVTLTEVLCTYVVSHTNLMYLNAVHFLAARTVERLPARVPHPAVQDPRAAEQDVSCEGQGESADHSDAVRQVN